MAKKEKKAPEGAPAWVVTYGDMMSLLLTFFVLLVSMSEMKRDVKFKKVMESIRIAFGYEGGLGRVPTQNVPEVSLLKKLMHIQIPDEIKHIGESPDKGLEGKSFRITQVREGLKITFGGKVLFERFTARLLPGALDVLTEFAEQVRGYNNIITIFGHTTLEDLPSDAQYADKDDLAFARAKQVRDVLVANDINSQRVRVGSVGDRAPLVRQAYNEDRRALNRSVEIIISEALTSELQGKDLTLEETVGYGG